MNICTRERSGKVKWDFRGDYVKRQGYELMRMTLLLFGWLLLAIAGIGIAGAADDPGNAPAFPGQPQIPHSFYGAIEAAGNPVPDRVPVEARAEGVSIGIPGNPLYTHAGGYGSADPFTPRLEVQGTLSRGTGLTFFVGGIQAEVQAGDSQEPWTASYPFSPGEVTELNLRVAVEVTPDPGYKETSTQTAPLTPAERTSAGGVNPSTEMMFGLIAILVILAIVAFYFGKRAEKSKGEGDQESSGDGDDPGQK